MSPLRVILGGGSHDPEVRVTVLPLRKLPADQNDRFRGGPAARDSRTFSPRLSTASPTPFGDNEALLRQIRGAVLAFPESATDVVGPRAGACLSGARGGSRTEPDSSLRTVSDMDDTTIVNVGTEDQRALGDGVSVRLRLRHQDSRGHRLLGDRPLAVGFAVGMVQKSLERQRSIPPCCATWARSSR